MKAVILAAGFGTRLYPLTENTPKALLKLGKRTLLDHLIEKLDTVTVISEIVVVVNGRFYLEFFKWLKNSNYRKPVHLVENSAFVPEKRMGAVKDLELALRSGFCGSDDFLVFCGDNYFDFPIGHFLLPCLGHAQDVFVGVYDVGDKARAAECGVVMTDSHNRITEFEEKPAEPKSNKVSVGVYYFPAGCRLKIHEYLETEKLNPDRIGDFIAWLSGKTRIYAVEFEGAWFDIGTLDSYEEAQRHAALGKTRPFEKKELTETRG